MSSDQSSGSIRDALQRHAHASTRQRAALARLLALTDTEVLAVEHLARTGGLTPAQLSATLQLTSGGTTALLHRLQRAGHIVRKPHPRDRRSVVLELTPAIELRAGALLSPAADELDRLVDALSEGERLAVERFLAGAADAAERHADQLVGDAQVQARAALSVPAPALWS